MERAKADFLQARSEEQHNDMKVSNREHFQEGVSMRHTKTGKAILLFAILLIMAAFVPTGLSLRKASKAA